MSLDVLYESSDSVAYLCSNVPVEEESPVIQAVLLMWMPSPEVCLFVAGKLALSK